ncbi:carbohydrate ABC transporter substrate-binding protein [Halonotius terrestris]|uniref:Carbohydrate ABC transporter substrate-binding protein n=1 Tax=Halonotius terrestris TaxID=2487750 RepID=A0A8J8TCA1_9EURY|nr:ABC transporter substrate-binding protein [Halonotius terrestris]TQQ79972.1 carbohydrate ABC transporter substrate-binding protein [Halonotius terrestris]
MSEHEPNLSRRTVLTTTSAAAVAGLAGCSGGGGGSGGDDGGDGGSGGNELELLHAWSSGDGNAAIAALIEGFQEENPDVEFAEEPVNGAARSNLDQVVLNKLQANDPPSTFQTWPGKTLEKFDGAYEDIEGDVWDEDLKENYLAGPQEQAQYNGNYVTVPLNIHRINNLFYNTAVLDEAGVDPASLSSASDVVDACATIAENTDAVPFAQQTSGAWSTVQLWETILLGQAGIDGYEAFINGDGDVAQVESALQSVADLREYYPSDSSSISFTEANTMVMDGDAAFIHQGDWAAGAYSNADDFNYGEDWGQVTYPGTSGNYLLNMDSFPYMANNPSPEATRKFLSYCGSAEGQVLFNAEKGSIPPRSDADVSALNDFQQDQFEDFNDADNQPPSIQHGLAVSPGVSTNISSAFSAFLESYNVSGTAESLINAFN